MFKMLMIEDNQTYSSELNTIMRGYCQLHITSSAPIGLNLANANRYDLIMIDVNMHSDSTGLDAVQAITRTGNHTTIPIVAFSITKLLSDKEFLFSHGFTHVISEPFNIRNFTQQIKFILTSKLKDNYFTHLMVEEKPSVPKIVY